MRANRKSGAPSEVEAIKTNPLLSQASRLETTSSTTIIPATLFENMDLILGCDGVRNLIVADKQLREEKYWL